jgi:hypothetical protein
MRAADPLSDDHSADQKDETRNGIEMLKTGEASENVPDRQVFEAGIAPFELSATLQATKEVPSLFRMRPAEVDDKFRLAQRVLECPMARRNLCTSFMKEERAYALRRTCSAHDRPWLAGRQTVAIVMIGVRITGSARTVICGYGSPGTLNRSDGFRP